MGYVGTQHCYIPVTVVLDERSLTPAARNRNANEMHKNNTSRYPPQPRQRPPCRRRRAVAECRRAAAAVSGQRGHRVADRLGLGDQATFFQPANLWRVV